MLYIVHVHNKAAIYWQIVQNKERVQNNITSIWTACKIVALAVSGKYVKHSVTNVHQTLSVLT